VRLSLFSRLFSRSKPQPVASTASGIPLRTRLDHGSAGVNPMRSTAIPARPRIALDAPSLVASAEAATDTEKAPAPFVSGRPVSREDEVVKATKMAPQEELSIKITEGLKNLSTVLGAIDEKLAAQSRTTELVAERLQALPRVLEGLVDSERSNLETLQALRGSMDKQNEVAQQTAEKLDKIPGAVDGLGTRIEQQTEAAAAVKTSVEAVSQSVRGLVDGSQRAQNSLITEFRRGQDEQRLRLEDLVERQRKMTLIVFGVAVVLVLGLVIVLTRLPHY
jgi:methyl-accepting chemotaxis protein